MGGRDTDTFDLRPDAVAKFRAGLQQIAILGEPLQFTEQEGGRFFLKLGHRNLYKHDASVSRARA